MTKLNGLSATEHPNFSEYWDRYVKSFNSLVQKLEKTGIEITELRELIAAVQDMERLSFWQSLRMLIYKIGGAA